MNSQILIVLKQTAELVMAGNCLRNRIVTMSSPGMTAGDPFNSQPATLENSMLKYGLHGIDRTSRVVSATGWFQRRDGISVKIHRNQKDLPNYFPPVDCFHFNPDFGQ